MSSFYPAFLQPDRRRQNRFARFFSHGVAARGLALFLGCFTLLNLAACLRPPGFDANLWWIDLRGLPLSCAHAGLLILAVLLVCFALRPPRPGLRRLLTLLFVAALCLVALVNSAQFFVLLARGNIRAAIPVPLSFLFAAGLLLILYAAARTPARAQNRHQAFSVALIAAVCAVLFPLLQMFCFGKTDYRRPADAAIVLGARAYADGRPSDALADRVRTACELYRAGLARKLIVSGGPGDGTVHETETMRRMAVSLGVRSDDILQDPAGLNTRATAKNTELLLTQLNASRVLVVSHFYHLPRIKLAFQQDGWDVFTVPARESYILRQLPFNMLREIAAFWVYYVKPLSCRDARQ
ncbi:MAG TPA: YdcF family protein [Verrucomicrobiae bacterium]